MVIPLRSVRSRSAFGRRPIPGHQIEGDRNEALPRPPHPIWVIVGCCNIEMCPDLNATGANSGIGYATRNSDVPSMPVSSG